VDGIRPVVLSEHRADNRGIRARLSDTVGVDRVWLRPNHLDRRNPGAVAGGLASFSAQYFNAGRRVPKHVLDADEGRIVM